MSRAKAKRAAKVAQADQLSERIETERRKLQRAAAVLLALDMLQSYAQTQLTFALGSGNRLKPGAMTAMLDHVGRLRTLLR